MYLNLKANSRLDKPCGCVIEVEHYKSYFNACGTAEEKGHTDDTESFPFPGLQPRE